MTVKYSLALALFGLCARPDAALANRPAAAAKWAGGFAGGALSGFVAHEYGHLVANVALGNTPRLIGVRGLFGVPFVAISPGITGDNGHFRNSAGAPFRAGRRGLAVISAAGFLMAHATSELLYLVDDRPYGQAPALWQGFAAFNVVLSLAYATTCLAHAENAYGDATGLAEHTRLPRPVVATALIVPALFDAGRAFFPRARWLAFGSWASKAVFVGLVVGR